MKNLIPLMQREWLQHRFAWTLLLLVPLALAVLPLSFGQIELDGQMARHNGPELAMIVSTLSIVITTAVIFLLVWVSSLFVTSSLARRDHADRSIEFWLSLPTGHAESLAAPLIVHLLLAPAVALLVGLLAGYGVSLLMVGRLVGLGEWFGLPWGSLLAGTLALVLRVAAGLPLATLWLMPLILLSILAGAWLKRWGLPLLAVSLGVGGALAEFVFGQPIVGNVLRGLGQGAGLALAGAGGEGLTFDDGNSPAQTLAGLPAWAASDFMAAVVQLASPLFLASLLASAVLFMALVLWRQRGASSAA